MATCSSARIGLGQMDETERQIKEFLFNCDLDSVALEHLIKQVKELLESTVNDPPKRLPYPQKLKDPRWQRKPDEIFQRDKFTCQECGSTTSLVVDNRIYREGVEPWDQRDDDFQTLCPDCHARITQRRAFVFSVINTLPSKELMRL